MHNNAPETQVSLILRLKDVADLRAWEEFVSIYAPVIYRVSLSRGFQSADAENIVQEVLLAVSNSIDTWMNRADRGSFRAWLLTIAHNEAIDQLRKKASRRLGIMGSRAEDLLSMVEADNDLSSCIDLEYKRSVLEVAAAEVRRTVSGSTWQAFWLTRVEGVSVEQAAERLSMRPGNIYLLRSRVMSKLQQVVQRLEQQP